MFYSPLTIGEVDPIFKKALELKQIAKEKEDWQYIKLLTPTVNFYTPVIIRNDP
jgi:hypothetical protein